MQFDWKGEHKNEETWEMGGGVTGYEASFHPVRGRGNGKGEGAQRSKQRQAKKQKHGYPLILCFKEVKLIKTMVYILSLHP